MTIHQPWSRVRPATSAVVEAAYATNDTSKLGANYITNLHIEPTNTMSFFNRGGASNNTPPPASYNRLPENNSGYSLPSGPRGGPRNPPPSSGYNDPSNALFEKRSLDRKAPPPRSGGRYVLNSLAFIDSQIYAIVMV